MKNDRTDQDVIWGLSRVGPRNLVLDGVKFGESIRGSKESQVCNVGTTQVNCAKTDESI